MTKYATRELFAREEQIKEAKAFILALFALGDVAKQWTVKEVFDASQDWSLPVPRCWTTLGTMRITLIALHHEKKIALRRYAHNLFKYSLSR